MLDDCNKSENETANSDSTDISVTLKALSLVIRNLAESDNEIHKIK